MQTKTIQTGFLPLVMLSMNARPHAGRQCNGHCNMKKHILLLLLLLLLLLQYHEYNSNKRKPNAPITDQLLA
jgi:hypothetical protein